jgi:hypothetical protein
MRSNHQLGHVGLFAAASAVAGCQTSTPEDAAVPADTATADVWSADAPLLEAGPPDSGAWCGAWATPGPDEISCGRELCSGDTPVCCALSGYTGPMGQDCRAAWCVESLEAASGCYLVFACDERSDCGVDELCCGEGGTPPPAYRRFCRPASDPECGFVQCETDADCAPSRPYCVEHVDSEGTTLVCSSTRP